MRGINRQVIFNEDEDCPRFFQALKYYKETGEYELYANPGAVTMLSFTGTG